MKESKLTAENHAKLGNPFYTAARNGEVMYAYYAKSGSEVYVHTSKNRFLEFENRNEFSKFLQDNH